MENGTFEDHDDFHSKYCQNFKKRFSCVLLGRIEGDPGKRTGQDFRDVNDLQDKGENSIF